MLLITGAEGLLGSALKQNPKDEASSGAPRLKCKAALHLGRQLDIRDLSGLRQFVKAHPGVTHIVNCAAFSQVDAAEEKREEAWAVNAVGPENLAIVAGEVGARLVHISTDYVFGGDGRRMLTEEDVVAPCNYYGESKLEGERRALDRGACVIRTSWIFGSGGKNFMSKLFGLLQSAETLCLTEDQWSRFTYAPDLAEAILELLDEKGLFHFANAGVASKLEFGLAMKEECAALGIETKARIIGAPGASFPSACKRPVYSALDTAKVEKRLFIRHWREALKEFVCDQLPVCS